ncbi:hypothetical protein ACFZC3_15325 [Streptomyces sp. NPDC007903]|uniref:hypothetical protein n=1 Tax=Streptomyces sp. NPDC007903 TaxID=3364786 RepID=UPI0036EF133B
MALGYAHVLYCDRRGCRGKTVIDGTRNARDARRIARRYGWRTDGGRDTCPQDAPSHRPEPSTEPPSHDGAETSHDRCDGQETR